MTHARAPRRDEPNLFFLEMHCVRQDRVLPQQSERIVHARIRRLPRLPIHALPPCVVLVLRSPIGTRQRGGRRQRPRREQLLREHDLGRVLRDVRLDPQPGVPGREPAQPAQKLARARDREARREDRAHERLGARPGPRGRGERMDVRDELTRGGEGGLC